MKTKRAPHAILDATDFRYTDNTFKCLLDSRGLKLADGSSYDGSVRRGGLIAKVVDRNTGTPMGHRRITWGGRWIVEPVRKEGSEWIVDWALARRRP